MKPMRSFMFLPIYKNIERRLEEKNFKVMYYSYDWRTSPLTIAFNLKSFLFHLSKSRKKIFIIAHSSGGLITRILFEHLKYPMDCIDCVFICGTPLYGFKDSLLYNREYKLYEKLCNPHIYMAERIALLTTTDINKCFENLKSTLIYFIPTSIYLLYGIEEIAEKTKISANQLEIVKKFITNLAR